MTTNATERQSSGSEAIPIAIALWTFCLVLLWFSTAFVLSPKISGDQITFFTVIISTITVVLHADWRGVKNNRPRPAMVSPQDDFLRPIGFAQAGLGLTALLNGCGAAANCSVSFSAFLPSLLITSIGIWGLCRLYRPTLTQSETLRESDAWQTANEKAEYAPGPVVDETTPHITDFPEPSKASGDVDFDLPDTAPNEFEDNTPVLREAQTLLTASGDRTSSGCVNSEIPSAEKSMELVITFDPPFKAPPDFEFELTEESLQARLLNRTCVGARVAVRSLKAPDASPTPKAIPFSLEWFAQEPEDAGTMVASQPISTNLP